MKSQVLAHAQVLVEREALGHVADAPAQRLGLAGHAQAEHRRRAAARREQPAEHADRGGLAGAVGPEEAVDGLARDLEVDVVDGGERAEAARSGRA